MRRDRDRRIARNISAWFRENARELPWRSVTRSPYHALVSELMLQQTQVARVVERFVEFIGAFPTIEDLAEASEDAVLAHWSGLGYYRRAKLLRKAAVHAVEHHDGELPSDARALEAFPGIGKYTAGAIASIAHGMPAPIVDGNVARVVLRLDGVEASGDDPLARAHLWDRAERLVTVADDPGAFNEGLMELGATVCTKANPRCGSCPVARSCVARREGTIGRIPVPKKASTKKTVHIAMAVIEDGGGRLLVERRGEAGLWAGLWQGPSLESSDRPLSRAALARELGVCPLKKDRELTHETTHRTVRFVTYRGMMGSGERPERGVFRTRAQVARLALSSPHRRLLLAETGRSPNKD